MDPSRDQDARAAADLWAACEAHLDAVTGVIAELLARDVELEPWRRTANADHGSITEALRAALRHLACGDRGAFDARVQDAARALGGAGVPFSAFASLAVASQRALVGPLVASYASEPARLVAAIGALDDLLGHALALAGEAYLARKDELLHEAEWQNEEAVALWRHVFEQDEWGVVVAYADTSVLRCANPAYARMTGYTQAELVGRPSGDMVAREDHDDLATAMAAMRKKGHDVFEVKLRRKDGTTAPVLVSGTIADTPSHGRLRISNVIDLTDRRRAAEDRERARELEMENRRVLEGSRMKSEFLANMSHELRTPLNAIIGFAEVLTGDIEPEPDERREFLHDILTSGRHLLALINDVLDLSKVEAGKLEFHPEPGSFDELASEVTTVVRALAAPKGVRVVFDGAPSLELVIDAPRLKQILYNYLSNAIKFTPADGAVTLRARAEGEDAFRLEVEDSGIGIAPGDLDKLFVEFQQIDAGSSKRHGGTGLGLALTKRLVEGQGGSVGVASVAGEGSTFFAVMPRRTRSGAALPAPRVYASRVEGAHRVLVVQHDPRDQAALVQAFVGVGCAVETAASGVQALLAARARRFDAVVLDVLLPDTSGLQVLAGVRRAGASASARVIVVGLATDARLVAALGVADFIAKPLDDAAVLAALRRLDLAPG